MDEILKAEQSLAALRDLQASVGQRLDGLVTDDPEQTARLQQLRSALARLGVATDLMAGVVSACKSLTAGSALAASTIAPLPSRN